MFNSFDNNELRLELLGMSGLKHVQNEMVPAVVTPSVGIIIVPSAIVDRNPHFGWITVVQAIRASIVFISPVVLRVVDIRIMVESVPVLGGVGGTP
jgi:hypothetical protein